MSWYDPRDWGGDDYKVYDPRTWSPNPAADIAGFGKEVSGWGSDLKNKVLGDPSAAYNTAAGAQTAAGQSYQQLGNNMQGQYQQLGNQQQRQYNGFGNQAWNMYNQAGGQAQQYMQPYNGFVFQPQGPGAYEQNWQGYAAGLGAPTAQQGAYSGYQQHMGQPGNMQNAYGGVQDWSHGPSAASNTYYDSMSSLSAPTQMSSYYAGLPGAGRSNAQGAYGQISGAMGQPGAMESWQQQNGGQFTQPGQLAGMASQGLYDGAGRSEGYDPNNVTSARDYAAGAMQRLGGPSAVQGASGEVSNIYRQGVGAAQGAGQREAFAGRQLPGMEQAGGYEQFARDVASGREGNPLDVVHKREMDALNQQMAARGHFNSGGALAASGNLIASQGAEDFRNRMDLARGGQEMQLARLNQAAGLAGQSDMGALGRQAGLLAGGSSLQGLAGQMDASQLGREGALAGAAGMASNEGMGMNSAYQQAVSAADSARLGRLQGMQGLAGAADQTRLAGLQGGAGAAAAAQQGETARYGLMDTAASAGDASELARSAQRGTAAGAIDAHTIDAANTMGNLAANADTSDLNRQQFGWNAGGQLDQFGQQQYQLQQLMAQGLDQETARRVLGQAGLAQNAQTFGQQRYDTHANDLFRMGQQQQNIYGEYNLPGMAAWQQGQMAGIGAYGQGQTEGINAYGQGQQNGINSNLNAANLVAMGDAAGTRQLYGLAGAAVGGFVGGPAGAYEGYQAGQQFGGGYGAPGGGAPMQMPGAGLYPGYGQPQYSPYGAGYSPGYNGPPQF